MSRNCVRLHFTDEETEAWLARKTPTMAHSYIVLGPRLFSPEFLHLAALLLIFLSCFSIPFFYATFLN